MILNNTGDGIAVYRSSEARINENTISGNGNDGIQVRSVSFARVEANSINNNGRNGVLVRENSGVRLVDSTTTTNNTEYGVLCETNSFVGGNLNTLNGGFGPFQADLDCSGITFCSQGNALCPEGSILQPFSL